MSTELTFKGSVVPEPSGVPTPGEINGVAITVESGALDLILEKINAWFDDRNEIGFVDSGSTSKTGDGFVVLEWNEYQIDPLFLKILANEDFVIDFALFAYGEGQEGEE